MPRQRERMRRKSGFGEELQEMLFPAPCAGEGAMNEQQRRLVLQAGWNVRDNFKR